MQNIKVGDRVETKDDWEIPNGVKGEVLDIDDYINAAHVNFYVFDRWVFYRCLTPSAKQN